MLKILFIGDIVGEAGVDLTSDLVPRIRRKYNLDLCVANAENAHHGKGISKTLARQLNRSGVDVITTGNHVWDKHSVTALNDETLPILRPANYPPGNPGKGHLVFPVERGFKVGILNLQARSFMYPIDCPFRKADEIISSLRRETMFILIDFHAETSAEKQALAWFLDGRVSALIGTHTHVQTADERILKKGTAFITDVGMTGPFDSVIGMNTEIAIKRFMLQTPEYYALAENNIRLNGVLLDINLKTGKAKKIERINFSKAEYGNH